MTKGLNLLITNSQEDQSYLVVRSLRAEASKIILGLHGDSIVRRWSALAPWSRHVDRRYRLPDPGKDWWAGLIQTANTAVEEHYICRVEQVCALEGITAIFPSFEPDIYVLAKNKPRLAKLGVVVIGPDYEALMIPLSKELTLRAAQRAGFPAPKTWSPAGLTELEEIIATTDPPWVIKPRFGAHAEGVRVVRQASSLRRLFAQVSLRQERPLIQEYIAGTGKQNYYLTVDRNFQILSLLTPEVLRTRRRGVTDHSSAVISSSTGPCLDELHQLVRNLEYWGCMTIQTKIDPSDGLPRFMEINPRVGDHLWFRTELGVNEPLIYLRLALDQPLPEIYPYPEGVLLLDPVDDVRNLVESTAVAALQGLRKILSPARAAPEETYRDPPGALLKDILGNYSRGKRKVMAPYVRHIFDDPLPCGLRNVKVLAGLLRGLLGWVGGLIFPWRGRRDAV